MNRRPDWLDERMYIGEVPPHARTQADLRAAEPGSASVQASLAESDARILSELPPDRFAAEVRRRRESASRVESASRASRSAPSRAAWGGAVLAASLALFFAIVPPAPEAPPIDESGRPASAPIPPTSEGSQATPPASTPSANGARTPALPDPQVASADAGWRSKGTADLVIQRETSPGGTLAPVTDSDTLAAGTRLVVSVPADLAWAAVFSIDSRGEMAQHWPLQGDSAAALRSGPLPRVWELDDSQGQETFVLIWSERPFGLEAPRKAVFVDREHPRLPAGLKARSRGVQRPRSPAP